MEISIIVKQAILFAHLVLFALALAAILREDIRLLLSSKIDVEALIKTGVEIKWLLIGLWCSGLILIMMDVGTEFVLVLAKPKLVAKIIVVAALTLNGALLHMVAFPMLTGDKGTPREAATIATVLGSLSTTSWFYASFVGSARFIQPYCSLTLFMALYILAIVLAISIGILFVRDRIEQMLIQARSGGKEIAVDKENWALAPRESDVAMLGLSRMKQ